MYEVRDPIHGFVQFDDFEKRIINSPPVQRLRDIHQLSLEFMVYPGGCHKRFEHSLGVMHLAGRIFDSLFSEDKLSPKARQVLSPELQAEGNRTYWRRVVRLAGLLHDVGHLPFSHAGEGLLPAGKSHEDITEAFLLSEPIVSLLMDQVPPIRPKDVIDCCLDYKKRPTLSLPPWKTILNDIVTHDVFGADRMDFLHRDSLHTGVAYGKFDMDRLISCLRLVQDDRQQEGTGDIALGVEDGGLHSAEGLLLARYFMYEQVYFHEVRRVYDLHLTSFIKLLREGRQYPTDPLEVIKLTDSPILSKMFELARCEGSDEVSKAAQVIMNRDHFRTVFTLTRAERKSWPDAFESIKAKLEQSFGSEGVMSWRKEAKGTERPDFLVVDSQEHVGSARPLSVLIRRLPEPNLGYLYCEKQNTIQASGIIENLRLERSSQEQGARR